MVSNGAKNKPTAYGTATDMEILACLADLIEPQERTCHDARQCGGWFLCSRCGAFLADGAVTNATNAIRPRYCPNCGAEVVTDDD